MNPLKDAWAAGRQTLNGWLSTQDSFVAEIMAAAGYDSVTVDMQHGLSDYAHFLAQVQAMRASPVVPMARVPWLEPGIIMKALDAGALGIICPMVNTAEEAARLVSCMRYPPKGARSYGPTRAIYHHGPGYYAAANESVLAIAMIETDVAVRNLEAICATEGLDGIYIGPSDLTLGVTQGALPAGLDREEPEMIDLIRRVKDTAQAAGLRAGIHCGTAAYAVRAIGWGFDYVTVSNDTGLLAAAARRAVGDVRAAMGEAPEKRHVGGGY